MALSLVSRILSWAYLILVIVLLIYSYYRYRKSIASRLSVIQVQEQAKSLTGASTIGSVIHLAGHPLLSRDQPVVLALASGSLSIYDYASPIPMDTLPLEDVLAVYTVVYDDDRIPHLDVIDSAAQAIQLEYSRKGQTWTCLFHHMQKLRPIDWYHALRQASYQQSNRNTE